MISGSMTPTVRMSYETVRTVLVERTFVIVWTVLSQQAVVNFMQ
jgi:hypothetical protein